MAEENCTHDCSSCASSCSSRTEPQSLLAPQNAKSNIRHVIGVVSGKGGVGKSLVTASLAVQMARAGYRTAILDADITGPSIPKIFGLHEMAEGSEDGILPVKTAGGIQVMSVNLLMEDEHTPVIWRGPIIAGTVKQFWTDVTWGEVDYMFVDMPPGTGDVPLTVFQSLPLDGIVIVTSPQELVSMIVSKAANMANMMNIPVLGIVENMSYILCPDCHKKISVFGESHLEEVAASFGYEILARIPLNPDLASLCDAGKLEETEDNSLKHAAERIDTVCQTK